MLLARNVQAHCSQLSGALESPSYDAAVAAAAAAGTAAARTAASTVFHLMLLLILLLLLLMLPPLPMLMLPLLLPLQVVEGAGIAIQSQRFRQLKSWEVFYAAPTDSAPAFFRVLHPPPLAG
jgi:hypothetical protein